MPVRYMNENEREELLRWLKVIPRGAFIGIGDIIDCVPTEKMTEEQLVRSRDFGDFTPGRFAWEFTNVKRFKTPIPAKGHQGFFYGSISHEQMIFDADL